MAGRTVVALAVRPVAVLYADAAGPYAGLPGVDVWHVGRDARLYPGPWPVVAHPPCARWSMLAPLVERTHGYRRGADGGCFAAALAAVRRYGGVLEHPAFSSAWRAHGLARPLSEGWTSADWSGGWTCCVSQNRYGHVARKLTWLYAVGCPLPSLDWGLPDAGAAYMVGGSRRGGEGREGYRAPKRLHMLHSGDPRRVHTPPPFRDLLLMMARSAAVETAVDART